MGEYIGRKNVIIKIIRFCVPKFDIDPVNGYNEENNEVNRKGID